MEMTERRVALVTGASKGIGRACALRLGREGMAVVINYRSSDADAERLAEEIRAVGGEAMLCRADVSDSEAVKAMFREIHKTYGRIDVLVNNAGIVKDEYLMMLSLETIDKCLDLNIKGYMYCAQQASLKMFRKRSGVIINISSVSSQVALAGQTVYSATKGAVNSMTRTMAKELAPYGIRVNAVAPGFVQTEMVDQLPEEKREEYLSTIPMKRFARVEEIAEAVAFLSSDASSYMTGQVLLLDGGLSL